MTTESAVIKRLKEDVENTFAEVHRALDVRKKLLLRQVDVIASQCHKQNTLTEETKFIPNEEIDIMESIRSFGKFNLPHLNFNSDLYVSEDYICPDVDHETMYKCLNTKDEVDVGPDVLDGERSNNEEPTLDAFDEKILKDSMENMNESIINITLREAKDLIKRAEKGGSKKINLDQQPNKVYKSDESKCSDVADSINGNDKIAQGSQTEGASSNKDRKPNITINNCNGIINLKNISNLTINCTGQTSIQTGQKADSSKIAPENRCGSEDVSSTVQSDCDDNLGTKDEENNSVSCEFYNRLIREIKNTIKQHHGSHKDSTDGLGNHMCSSSTESNGNESYNRKLLLKNFENLKIVLENNENETHPVQIEQWLTEIISETEIEPMQNTGILEHSKFARKNLC